jgi:hypothetical protein
LFITVISLGLIGYNYAMYKILLSLGILAVPVVVSAASATAQAAAFVKRFNELILYPTIALLSAVALLVFLFGCFQYIALSDNDQARPQGVKPITGGIIGMVVMLSAFAILTIVTATLGLDDVLDCSRNPSASGCVDVLAPPGSSGPITPVGAPVTPGPITPVGAPVTPGPITPSGG